MRKFVFSLFFFCISTCLWGQVSVTPGDTLQAYIHSLVRTLVGKGVQVHNIRYTGSPLAIGTFSDPTGSVGLTNGITLSTGNVKTAEGPNTFSTPNPADVLNQPGAEFMRQIAAAPSSYDAAILEFDIVPLKNNFSIRFVFGSEEYNQQSSILSDIFVISVVGPTIPSGRNIAIVPGTSNTYISASNINNDTASFGRIPDGPCKNCNYFIYNQPGSTITGYNSYTTAIEASLLVSPCQTYHIAIGITDLVDAYGNSGVFIEPGSFGGEGVVSEKIPSGNGIVEICSNESYPVFSVTGTTPGVTYQWYIDDAPASIFVKTITTSTIGEYKVVGTMPSTLGGCTFSDSLVLHVGEIFTLSGINNVRVCTQDSAHIYTSPNKPGNYTYSWKPQAHFYNPTLPGQNVRPLIDTDYYAEVKNDGGCLVKDTLTVIVNPVIYTINPHVPDTLVCHGNIITLTSKIVATSSPSALGSDNFQIRWYNTTGSLLYTGNPIIVVATTAGAYVDSLTSDNGCIVRDSVYLRIEHIALRLSNDTAVCVGKRATISASGANSYQWTSNTSGFGTSTLSGFSVNPLNSATYFVEGTGQAPLFCKKNDSVTVTVNPPPVITRTPDTTICIGSGIKIHVSGAGIVWNPAIIFPADSVFKPVSNSTYKFVATSIYNCVLHDSINITTLPVPRTTITGNTSFCLGEQTQLTVSGGNFYNWYTLGTSSVSTLPSPVIVPSVTGYYFVDAKQFTGCTFKDSVYIRVNSITLTGFILAKHGTVCHAQEINDTLTGPAGYFYQWQPGDIANRSITVSDSGYYQLTIKGANQCTASASIYIKEFCISTDTATNTPDRELFIPNIFTPNGDNVNDTFFIRGLKPGAGLKIYSRWGNIVYESVGYENKWDANGMPDGLYYFSLTIAIDKTYNGWVEVIR